MCGATRGITLLQSEEIGRRAEPSFWLVVIGDEVL
jgi:hypothetical protein